MFRLVCYVEDKHLPKALHALAGLVLNMDPPQPVTNAVVVKPSKGASIKEASPNGTSFKGTSFKGQLIDYLAARKGAKVSTQDMKRFFESVGANVNSMNGTLTSELIENKILKRIGRGLFAVT